MDRDAFLARISSAALRTELPAPPEVRQLPDPGDIDLVELFRNRAQLVNTVVHGPMPRHSVPRSVAGIAAGHEVRTFGTWDELPAPGVPGALSAEGYERVEEDAGDRDEFRQTPYTNVDFGITGSSYGLAESGSVVLEHGPGRSRLLSCLPGVHVALVRTETIYKSISHWAQEHPDSPVGTANLVIVTGPSRTGDIEQNLNLGVHGPKHVHVVLIR